MRQNGVPITAVYDPEMEVDNKTVFLLHKRSADLDTGWHQHSKAQLLYAEDGILRLYTETGSYFLPSRHCAWIPAHTVHRVTSPSPRLFLRTLYFKIDQEQTHAFYSKFSVFQVNNLLREMIVYTERWAHASESAAEEVSFLIALKFILPDLQGASLSLHLPTSEHPKVKECLQLIMENLSEKISVEETARKLNLSTRTLARLFQQELNMSFTGFLKLARIIKALEWLSQPDATVAATAFKVGYDSIPTFSNNFYEIVGLRPQAFIQKQH